MFKPVIIIPFYNQASLFKDVIKKVTAYKIPVLVIDDGSDEGQACAAEQACKRYKHVTYLRRSPNCGKGAAVSAGIHQAVLSGYTHALQIDADGQHNTADIPVFLDMAKQHPDCIINSVPVYDSSVPKSRLYGRKITQFWVKVETLNADIGDSMCGFRVYPLNLITPVAKGLRFLRMGFDIEILVKCWRSGLKIINQPTRVIYPENGISHFKTGRDNVFISLLHTYLCCTLIFYLCGKGIKKCKMK